MDYSEALQFLYGLSRFGMRLGLDIPRRLAESAGSPERDLAFIHVAGTNGKGSTCAFLESVYRRSGRRVGLYTSPHLVSFRERIQVNREMIPEADVARLARDAQALLKELPAGAAPTFFEFVTLLALLWFREQRCDLVLWETGLGGRLDATNIVRPLASVITNIGWDHMQWLGGTLQEIAREKAAIVKPGVPVITAATQGAGLEEIERAAVAAGAPLRIVRADGAEARVVRAARLPLAGEHQVLNAALARAVVEELRGAWPVSDAEFMEGLANAEWRGRFEVARRDGQTIVLDGAHNRPAFEALAKTLRAEFGDSGYALILGMLADKDLNSAAGTVLQGATRVVIVPIHSNRGGDPQELADACARAARGRLVVERADDVPQALAMLADEPRVVIAGSLYLVGEAMAAIFGGNNSERRLNDWGRSP